MTCPPITELCTADASSRFEDHLQNCARCRAIVTRVGDNEPARDTVTEEPAPTKAPSVPFKAGGVWTFWAPGADEYLVGAVLDAGETDLLIAPLLEETDWAADADLTLDMDVLGYAALVPIWAGDYVLLEQAVEPVGMLSERYLAGLTQAYDAFFAGEPIPEPAGPPVSADTDPRLAAHAARANDLLPYFSPWAQLNISDELGPVLAHRRDDIGVELGEWSDDLGVEPQVWAAFEAGEADPYVSVAVTIAAKAIRALQLMPSRRVVSLAHNSVEAHHVSDVPLQGTAMARRRRGVAPTPRRNPTKAKAAADQYAASLEKELGL